MTKMVEHEDSDPNSSHRHTKITTVYKTTINKKLKPIKKLSTTKTTVPGKDLIQNGWRNKRLLRKAKVERIQYHQATFTTNVKGTYVVKKNRRRKKIYKINPK